MRRLAAVTLAVLLALPAGDLGSAPANATISGVVRLAGRPVAGVTVAFVELTSGAVVRATSKDDGSFEATAPPGEYAVTTESVAGLTVEKAPVRVAVAEGKPATAEIELVSVPSAVGPDAATAAAAAAAEPPAAAPPATAPPATEGASAQPPTPGAPGAPVYAETTGKGAQIQYEPVTCFVAGEFPLLDASIQPIASVARARVYFKAAAGDAFYYVEMTQDQERYFGKLPRPRVEASPIKYYLQSTTTEFEESQTREIDAVVVKDRSECGDRKIAAAGPAGPVTVFSASTGVASSPAGFAAVAASGVAAGAVAIIAAGAAAAGIVGGVVVGPGEGAVVPPGPVEPSAIPIPTPAPLPTPVPITTFR